MYTYRERERERRMICVYVYIYIYIERERDRWIYRWMDGWMDGWTDPLSRAFFSAGPCLRRREDRTLENVETLSGSIDSVTKQSRFEPYHF